MFSWRYGEHSDDKKMCLATGDSVTLLIALAVETGVHAAHESGTRLFKVSAEESFSFPASPDADLTCQEPDENNAKREIGIGVIEEVELKKKN